nr:hypothetical protein CFP56_72354 [Quercus suber]
MFQTAGYPVHPPYFSSPYEYRSPPQTPPNAAGGSTYYSPRHYVHQTAPSATKGHSRRATNDGTAAYTYTYTTPRRPTTTYTPTKDYSSTPATGYYTSAQSTPQRRPDYVSGRQRASGTPYRDTYGDGRAFPMYSTSKKHYSTGARYVYDDNGDRSHEYLPRYEQHEPCPPPYSSSRQHVYHCHESRADQRYHDQVPIYTTAESTQHQRPRRASYTTKPAQPQPRPARPSTASKPLPPKATAEDARRARIPAGYSYKNWDPTEEPILLLGSVFDANSLGKWIYDWTVFYYGPATPMTEVAGDLWLLLIHLAGKIKRAEVCLDRIRRQSSRETVDDFLDSGERLWRRFSKLLKICEEYMWRAAKKESGDAKNVTMGQNSGCEFVDAIFGRDRELERTEKLMTGMRLWSMRFDANCEDILRNPGA